MEAKVEEKKEETKKDQETWDKERQRADQAESVAAKARTETQQYATALEDTKSQLAEATQKLESSQKETQDKKDELNLMDSALVDSNVISNFEKVQAKETVNAAKLAELEKFKVQYETDRKDRLQKDAVDKARDEILTDCDSEFSPKFRTEALKMADELVDSGKEKRPVDKYGGYKLMRECYRKVSEKETSGKADAAVDTGAGGAPPVKKAARKAGTMKEVLADMKKDQAWRKEPL